MKLTQIMNEGEEKRPLSNEVKKHFLEIVSTYNKYQESLDRKSDIQEIAETLGGITEAARTLAIHEGDDWFDKHTVKRNMSELDKLGQQFDKCASEANSLDQRLGGLYEDMGHILSRYYKMGEITEDQMKERLGMNESVGCGCGGTTESSCGCGTHTHESVINEEPVTVSMRNANGSITTTLKEDDVNEAGDLQFVCFIDTTRGKKLLKVFKSQRAANMFLKKSVDTILSKTGVESIGTMSEKEWNNKEAKYAIESVVNESVVNEIQYDDALAKFNKELENNSEIKKAAKHYKKSVKDIVKVLQSRIKVNRYSDKSIKQISINFTEDGPLSSKVTIKSSQNHKQNESINESVSKEAMGIAGFTGTRGSAVQNFIDDYSLNSKKLFKYISKADLKKRLEFVNAIAGTRGNKNQGKIVGMFGESVSEGDGLWANIRAKKARGEKPAHKNSQAHKDAVKAGEKINKEESVVKEAKFGYKDSKATYITKHKDEYKTAEKLNKGNEVKFYDTLSQMEDKIGHPKFMIFLSNALRGYTVDMYKDPKIKNPQDAQEALFLLSK